MDYFGKGDCDHAVPEAMLEVDFTQAPGLAAKLKRAYSTSGCKGFLLARIGMTNDPKNQELYFPYQVAADYALLGDKDKAIYWLNRCYEEGGGMGFVKVDSTFASLHSDPRFSRLLRKIGFPQ